MRQTILVVIDVQSGGMHEPQLNGLEIRWFVAFDFDFDGSDKAEDWFVFGVFRQNLSAGPAQVILIGEEKPVDLGSEL